MDGPWTVSRRCRWYVIYKGRHIFHKKGMPFTKGRHVIYKGRHIIRALDSIAALQLPLSGSDATIVAALTHAASGQRGVSVGRCWCTHDWHASVTVWLLPAGGCGHCACTSCRQRVVFGACGKADAECAVLNTDSVCVLRTRGG